MKPRTPDLPPGAFGKADGGDDAAFYAPPRLVTHIDEAATQALTAFYRSILPSGAVILDLMSSWISHLPEELETAAVIGHGMNLVELEANPRLTRRFVQDFNRAPTLPLEGASIDAAVCCVGVQYLQRPFEVFAEVARVLRPGAPFIISFSNRCFPTKAIMAWRMLGPDGHADLVRLYMDRAGFSAVRVETLADGETSDPLTAVIGRR